MLELLQKKLEVNIMQPSPTRLVVTWSIESTGKAKRSVRQPSLPALGTLRAVLALPEEDAPADETAFCVMFNVTEVKTGSSAGTTSCQPQAGVLKGRGEVAVRADEKYQVAVGVQRFQRPVGSQEFQLVEFKEVEDLSELAFLSLEQDVAPTNNGGLIWGAVGGVAVALLLAFGAVVGYSKWRGRGFLASPSKGGDAETGMAANGKKPGLDSLGIEMTASVFRPSATRGSGTRGRPSPVAGSRGSPKSGDSDQEPFSPVKYSKGVRVSEFATHVALMKRDSDLRFSQEFEEIRNLSKNQFSVRASQRAARLVENRYKNRFVNILPCE